MSTAPNFSHKDTAAELLTGAPFSRVPAFAQLASLRLTLACLCLLGIGIIYSHGVDQASVWWIAAPLALGATNLVAAIMTNRTLHAHHALLLFHMALLVIVVLLGLGQLTYFRANAELAEGESFTGQVNGVRQGPLHREALDKIHFTNEGFSIRYAAGLRRAETVNRVRVAGESSARMIGDIEPLIAEGYRFYTSFNKGFALVFTWTPSNGTAVTTGRVHLPSYPLHEYEQATEWTPPGTSHVIWNMLRFDKPPIDENREGYFAKPTQHDVVVRIGDRRQSLAVGESLDLSDGQLRYDGLSTWMGYSIFYDWTTPWLFVASFAAILFLGWHVAKTFAKTPWNTQ